MIIGDLIAANASRYPDRPAVKFGERVLTWAEFNARVNKLITALGKRGVRKGERLALLAGNIPELLEVYGAAEKGGYVTAPLNWRLSHRELRAVIDDARPTVLIVQAKYLESIQKIWPELRGVRFVFVIDEEYGARTYVRSAEDGWEAYEALLSQGTPGEPSVQVGEEDPVYLLYTSGTTGSPRGAVYTHARQIGMAQWIIQKFGLRPEGVNLNVLPLFHTGGHIFRLAHSCAGSLNVLKEAFEPTDLLRTIDKDKVTFVHLVPTMVSAILELPNIQQFHIGSIETFLYAASPMPVELLRRALRIFGLVFTQCYGLTESGPIISLLEKSEHVELEGQIGHTRLASAGRPIAEAEVEIRDMHDQPPPEEQIGEICVRSPYVMTGYWGKPELTAEALKEGWLHTGDMGFLDKDRFLYVVDRKNDMIISGGENIYPREVEEVLYRHPSVLEAAVIGVPDEKWVEAVKAVIVLRKGFTATEAEIVEFCKAHLASYKKPRVVEFRAELPKSPAGKILRRQLR